MMSGQRRKPTVNRRADLLQDPPIHGRDALAGADVGDDRLPALAHVPAAAHSHSFDAWATR